MKPLFEKKWYNQPKAERRRKKTDIDYLEAEIQKLRDAGGACGEFIGIEEQIKQAFCDTDWDEVMASIRRLADDLTARIDSAPKVHGFMIYKCDDCGKEFQVYLEQGIEDDSEPHKPCPFMIKCPYCKDGLAQDMYCRVWSYEYLGVNVMPLTTRGSFYFANVEGKDCGQFRTVS